MKRESRVRLFGAFLAGVSLLGAFAAGCSSEPEAGKTVTDPKTEQAEIDRIKNDPNMPAPAKAAALKGMEEGKKAALQAQKTAPK